MEFIQIGCHERMFVDAADRCRWAFVSLKTSLETVDPAQVGCLRPTGSRKGPGGRTAHVRERPNSAVTLKTVQMNPAVHAAAGGHWYHSI